ncbi:unnamed protein product [Pleuronectes platessa]|uniref:Uncharacterized protein n=1 Tax=Pleuronectes platessa TaxID=8262 RepID=A0A9N7VU90_PLEPL|nr:unnamed protein product [Pleuronectes platessa]
MLMREFTIVVQAKRCPEAPPTANSSSGGSELSLREQILPLDLQREDPVSGSVHSLVCEEQRLKGWALNHNLRIQEEVHLKRRDKDSLPPWLRAAGRTGADPSGPVPCSVLIDARSVTVRDGAGGACGEMVDVRGPEVRSCLLFFIISAHILPPTSASRSGETLTLLDAPDAKRVDEHAHSLSCGITHLIYGSVSCLTLGWTPASSMKDGWMDGEMDEWMDERELNLFRVAIQRPEGDFITSPFATRASRTRQRQRLCTEDLTPGGRLRRPTFDPSWNKDGTLVETGEKATHLYLWEFWECNKRVWLKRDLMSLVPPSLVRVDAAQ